MFLLITSAIGLSVINDELLLELVYTDSANLAVYLFFSFFSLEGISLKAITEMGGLHQMLGMRDYVYAANPADSIISIPDYQSSNKLGASFETPSGRFLVCNFSVSNSSCCIGLLTVNVKPCSNEIDNFGL